MALTLKTGAYQPRLFYMVVPTGISKTAELKKTKTKTKNKNMLHCPLLNSLFMLNPNYGNENVNFENI